ncbi:MAG TPA: hypothetical protein HPP76_00030 [Desulfuromonadales bacterium]|nr:hypothetical protein [Desulfuromonadales bacterium]
MPDHLLIYLIVLLNALSQSMLIWRLKLKHTIKWKFCCSAIAVPLILAGLVRLLIAQGIIHSRISEQSSFEHVVTSGLSMLLIGGPWLVTITAILVNRRLKAAMVSTA